MQNEETKNFDMIDELTPVSKNSRRTRQDAHLLFNPEKGKNGKFMVNDEIFQRLNLNNYGFHLYVGEGSAYVAVVVNENAVQYAGRPDSETKSQQFSSPRMREALNNVGLEGNEFWLDYAGEKDGVEYYQLVTHNPDELEEAAEEVSRDVADEAQEEEATEEARTF